MQYQVLRQLGRGAFSAVDLVRLPDGGAAGRKCFPLTPHGISATALSEMLAYTLAQNVPGMVQGRGMYLSGSSLCILETAYQGDVSSLAEGDLPFRINLSVNVFRTVVPALRALHSRGILHLDVKPANVFHNGPDDIALGDPGVAYFSTCAGSVRHALARGSPLYYAPELDQNAVYKESDYTSAALTCLELLTGARNSYRAMLAQFPAPDIAGVDVAKYISAQTNLFSLMRVQKLAPGFVEALSVCMRERPSLRHGAQLNIFLGSPEPAPFAAPRSAPRDPEFRAIVEEYRAAYARYKPAFLASQPEDTLKLMVCKLLDLAARLHAVRAPQKSSYTALFSILVKLYVADNAPSAGPPERTAALELDVLQALSPMDICGSDALFAQSRVPEDAFELSLLQ